MEAVPVETGSPSPQVIIVMLIAASSRGRNCHFVISGYSAVLLRGSGPP